MLSGIFSKVEYKVFLFCGFYHSLIILFSIYLPMWLIGDRYAEEQVKEEKVKDWLTYSRFKEDQLFQPNITQTATIEDEHKNKWTMKLQVLITQDDDKLDLIYYDIKDSVESGEMTPILMQAPENGITVKIGSNVNIACDALSRDTSLHGHRVYWYHGYHRFFNTLERRNYDDDRNSSRIKIEAGGERNPKVLEIRNATKKDEGWYTCVVQKTTVGYTFASTLLKVTDTAIKEPISPMVDLSNPCIIDLLLLLLYGLYKTTYILLIRKWKRKRAAMRR